MDSDYSSGGGRSFGRSGGGGYQGTPQRDEKSGGYRLHVGGIGDGVDEQQVRDVFDKVKQFLVRRGHQPSIEWLELLIVSPGSIASFLFA